MATGNKPASLASKMLRGKATTTPQKKTVAGSDLAQAPRKRSTTRRK
jgi:hypothetical protein